MFEDIFDYYNETYYGEPALATFYNEPEFVFNQFFIEEEEPLTAEEWFLVVPVLNYVAAVFNYIDWETNFGLWTAVWAAEATIGTTAALAVLISYAVDGFLGVYAIVHAVAELGMIALIIVAETSHPNNSGDGTTIISFVSAGVGFAFSVFYAIFNAVSD